MEVWLELDVSCGALLLFLFLKIVFYFFAISHVVWPATQGVAPTQQEPDSLEMELEKMMDAARSWKDVPR